MARVVSRLGQAADGVLDAAGIVGIAHHFARHETAHDEQQGRRDGEDGEAGQLPETVLPEAFQRLHPERAPDEGRGATDPEQGKAVGQPDQPCTARVLARRCRFTRLDGWRFGGGGRSRARGDGLFGLLLGQFEFGEVD